MHSSKYPKLSQHTRKQMDKFYLQKQPIMDKEGKIIRYKKVYTKTKLADLSKASRQTVGKIIKRGKNRERTIHKPIIFKILEYEF